MNNDSRPLFQHGTLSAVDDAVTLRHATLPQIAAELRRRAEPLDASEVSETASIAETLAAYDPQWAGVLRRMARRLEANAPT